jgi:ribonuclease HI
MSFFYAVAAGHNIGIYANWDECKKNIEDYINPVYKKFSNEEDAKIFLNEYADTLYVYTDGACHNNGSKNAKAGIGIFFSKDNPNNVSEKLEGENLTNNIAELSAAIKAINIIKKFDIKNKIIVTDSEYVIKCATTYGDKLAVKEWLTSKKTVPPNLELVKRLYQLTKKYNIKYKHIAAHTDNKDRHSISNYYADKLANECITDKCKDNKNKSFMKKIYLNVPYSEKDLVKTKGGRWDAEKKKWYIFENNTNKEDLMETYKLK